MALGGAAAPYKSRKRRGGLGMGAATGMKPGVGATGKGQAVMPKNGARFAPAINRAKRIVGGSNGTATGGHAFRPQKDSQRFKPSGGQYRPRKKRRIVGGN